MQKVQLSLTALTSSGAAKVLEVLVLGIEAWGGGGSWHGEAGLTGLTQIKQAYGSL